MSELTRYSMPARKENVSNRLHPNPSDPPPATSLPEALVARLLETHSRTRVIHLSSSE